MSQLLHKRNRITKTDLDAVDVDPLTGDPTYHHIPVPTSGAHSINLTRLFPSRRFILGVAGSLMVLVATALVITQYVVTQAEVGRKLESEKAQRAAMSAKFANSEQLVGKLSLHLEEPGVEVTSIDSHGGKAADDYGIYSVPQQQTGGRHYSNPPLHNAGMGLRSDPSGAAVAYQKSTSFFEDHYFTKVESGKQVPGPSVWGDTAIAPVAYTIYASKNVLCLVSHTDGSQAPFKSHIVGIGCGDKSSYEQAARKLDSFYAAYSKSFTRPPSYIALGMPVVSSGPDDAKQATVLQSDTDTRNGKQFEGMYMQQPGKNNWVYIGTVDEQHR